MLIDSHCHLNFPEFTANFADYLLQMQHNQVDYALCVGTRPDNLERIIDLATVHANLFASVGIHPDEPLSDFKLSKDFLLQYVKHPKVIAIGETGLDYYHIKDSDMSWQHQRFILHIEAAKIARLPLIIHTRESIADTLYFLKEHSAMEVGAVMHCFTENLDNAKKALDLGCYISISGIVTFKNAQVVQEMAKYIPLDRLLIETDAPFLAPMPFRGKLNHPALVKYTAQFLADLKGISLETLAKHTTLNFFNLFSKAKNHYAYYNY